MTTALSALREQNDADLADLNASLQALTDRLSRDIDRMQANAALRKERGCATEYDVLQAQAKYERAEIAWRDELVQVYGPENYYEAKYSEELGRGAEGSLLRQLWEALEAARENFRLVDRDYCLYLGTCLQ